jgi:ABC-type nickel/cobalt efflux system permease component RcnA
MPHLRSSKRTLVALLLAATAIVALPLLTTTPKAAAHPLGNFTINRYSRIELAPQGVSLRYVLDLAEIPAFQERQQIDADGDGELSAAEQGAYARAKAGDLAGNLDFRIAGRTAALSVAGTDLSFPAGVGGLNILRFVVDYTAPMPAGWERDVQQVEYVDANYEGRAGWREIVVRSLDGVTIADSTATAQDASNELRAYPSNGLANPLAISHASFSFAPGAGTAIAATSASTTTSGLAERANNRFTSLVTSEDLSVPFFLGAMAVAFAFGALHALGPGHGKTIVGAYLVGERGTARHAVLLGLLVTATHTSAVFALAFVTLYASQFIVPERLYPWLSLTSGLFVVGLGALLLVSRARGILHKQALGRAHAGARAHEHNHGHTHEVSQEISWKALAALGISGGILPCPSALVVLLGAISLHRVGLGLLLVIGFSAGLAMALMTIGLALVWAGRLLSRWQSMALRRHAPSLAFVGKLAPVLPALSAFAVTAIGIVMTLRAVQ